MKNKSLYTIHFVGLKLEHPYSYLFDIRNDFFEPDFFKTLQINIKQLNVELKLIKQSSFLNLQFSVFGSILSDCDRCTNEIQIPILNEFELIYKFVNNPSEFNTTETDPDIRYIAYQETEINLYEVLNEFVLLSIPEIKKCQDDGKGPFCNKEILKIISN